MVSMLDANQTEIQAGKMAHISVLSTERVWEGVNACDPNNSETKYFLAKDLGTHEVGRL